MKKVLVTGANGLLGANTVRAFCKKGFAVRALIRPDASLVALADVFYESYHGSVDCYEDVYESMKGCHYVVHAAAITAQWGIDRKVYEKINIGGTENVVRACLEQDVEKLIFISTANTFGPGPLTHPGTELNGFNLFKINAPYINTKYIAQQTVLESVIEKKLPAIIINPTFMIGAYDAKPSSGKLVQYAWNKKWIFYPPGGKSFVHVEDVSQSIVNACSLPVTGECYLLSGENLSYKAFFKRVGDCSGKSAMLIPIPALVLRIAGWLGSLLGGCLKKNFILNNAAAYMLCLDNYYDGQKAAKELGIQYTPIHQAVTDALAWFKHRP